MSDPVARPTALPGYEPMGAAVRTDAERFPALDPSGRERLDALRQHAHAPAWSHACGDLLTDVDHLTLEAWRREVPSLAAAASAEPPAWLVAETERLARVVPHLRRLGVRAWADVPTISRADLARGVADFVPLDVPLDRVVQGTSSGSSGSALVIPWHPVDIAKDLALLDLLLTGVGVDWREDPSRMGLLSVVDQEQAFTYASAMTLRGGQSMSRVSLHASAWADAGARRAFLTAADPQVVTGSALTLQTYAALDLPCSPLALVSGAVDLATPARAHLETTLGVPVLDLYGLREVGPVACETATGAGHVLVPRRAWVEVVDEAGDRVADGTAGEITVSSLENPYLPLLRYRTGDRGALVGTGTERRIVGLEGRSAVTFAAGDGRRVQSVELTQQLQRFGVRAWAVVQDADGSVTTRCLGGDADGLRKALEALLDRPVTVETVAAAADLGPGKPRRFTSAP
ncbi:CoF synthetase [Terrabacter sp. LjRoot27]|uniref:CoF synthetase n=1 Tax=Terrabacter sp. LjRoot27 TaxID=3342306 RepID=UPI003ED0E40D